MSPAMTPLDELCGRRGRLRDHRPEGGLGAARRRHAHHRERGRPPSRCRATRTSSRWCSPGSFPTDSDDYPELRDALEKLKLNDAALFYEPETSQALGFGFRCGFLGLLHMEIVRERLEREFDLDLLVTAPNVAYRVRPQNDPEWIEVHTPSDMPDAIEEVEEPYIKASVIVPKEYVGAVMELCNERRGRFDHMEYLVGGARPPDLRAAARRDRARLLRPAQVADARATRASTTTSSASGPGQLVRVDVLVGGDPVDALSLIVHRDFAYDRGRAARREAAPGDPAADVRRRRSRRRSARA